MTRASTLGSLLTSVLPSATGTAADEGVIPVTGESDQPHGAIAREEAALRRARAVSTLLDEAVRVPGTNFRVGLDPLVGVLPVGGDAVAAALSLYPILEAYRFDLPRRTLAKMVLLVAIDAVIGSVPVLGTVFDAFWKANTWNVQTLEEQLQHA